MNKGGGIQREGVKRGFDLPFFHPRTGERIAICAFNGKHAMLEHPELIERLGMRGGKIDVPTAVDMMQFRCPDQLAHRAGVGLAPDNHLFGIA